MWSQRQRNTHAKALKRARPKVGLGLLGAGVGPAIPSAGLSARTNKVGRAAKRRLYKQATMALPTASTKSIARSVVVGSIGHRVPRAAILSRINPASFCAWSSGCETRTGKAAVDTGVRTSHTP